MKYFIDTNIIIDILADRKPYSNHAILLLESASENKIKLFTSSHTIATTYYILSKYMEDKSLRKALESFVELIKVLPVDESILLYACRSNLKDFEDAIQLACALSVKDMNYIVTRNLKDFKKCPIKVATPDMLLKEL